MAMYNDCNDTTLALLTAFLADDLGSIYEAMYHWHFIFDTECLV